MEFSIGTALQPIRLLATSSKSLEWSHVVNQPQIFGVNTGYWDTGTHCLTSVHLFHLIDVWGAQSQNKTCKKEKIVNTSVIDIKWTICKITHLNGIRYIESAIDTHGKHKNWTFCWHFTHDQRNWNHSISIQETSAGGKVIKINEYVQYFICTI